MNKDEQNNSL